MNKGAIISECGKYRYQLWRIWDESKPLVLFIMHNPSIADGKKDDPTIRRCEGYARLWGFGGFYVGNLSPFRATDPDEMIGKQFGELFPVENIRHTNEMKTKCTRFILAYGNPVIKDSIPEIIDDCWEALKLTKSGNPCHPLYLRKDLTPFFINKQNQ